MTQVELKERPRKESAKKVTLLDRVTVFALRLFGGPSRRIAGAMPSLRQDILMSNMRNTADGVVALALLTTLLTALVSLAMVGVAFLTGFLLLTLAVVAIPIAFLISLNAPRFSKSSRSYALDNELPFLIGYMEVLAGGNVSPVSTLRRISKMDKLLPASSKEAKLILVDTDVFGLDPITALEKAARYNPNKSFSEFLYGYTTILKTGGDAQAFVNNKLKETMDERSTKIKRTSETLGTLAEAYITLTAVLGISLFTLYQVQAIVSHSQAGVTSILMFSFVLIPIISGIFLWVIDGLGTKQPYLDLRPYKAFGICGPIGGALFLLPLPIPLFLHASLALITAVLVPGVLGMKYNREKMGLEAKLPDFIRDIAENRKVGLSPEMAIESLTTKGYGRLTYPVKKMGAQISWGLELSRVINTFVRSVGSWLTKVVGSLMLEVVDVGGGTVRSFSEMADFTRKINDLEAEKRAQLRPYLFVIYMAAMLIVVTTFLMIYFLTETALSTSGAAAAPTVSSGTVEELLVAAIFESWVVGVVAGKIGEGSVAAGFKHSTYLVIISIITVYVASTIISIPL